MNKAATETRHLPYVQVRMTKRLSELPWWVLLLLFMAAFLIYKFTTDLQYQNILVKLSSGVKLTILVTVNAYAIALVVGLITAFGQMSKNIVSKNIALFYVQIVRGIPVLVLIFYTALVIIPEFVSALNALGGWLVIKGMLKPDNYFSTLNVRNIDFAARGIIALAINYGAFSSEVFRAGIQSIEKGQIEAANALGLNWIQTMRFIILPQAIRRILPPLGNDFISMLKESSLVSVLGVSEITLEGKKYAGASFLYPQTYNTVAFLYLSMTLILSMVVKWLERRMQTDEET
ncbi:MAG: amino acid ABC transporter permease [Chloroflexota bacterium]